MLAAPAWAGFGEGGAAYLRGGYPTALREFRPLAEQGDADAQFLLGVMYDEGWGVAQDYAAAVRWYRKSAVQGDASAQYNLGLMYNNGQGVPQDYAAAVRWYRKAAAQGYADAQFLLGVMYDEGRGVAQDYAAAVSWFRKAAAQGNASAQYNLGVKYDKGQGVPQDFAEAVKWYRKAAVKGYTDAQVNLGFMYGKGQGVLQDYVQAHKWYNLAAVRGDKMAVKNRNIVAKLMTPTQVAEAQRLARAWRPKQSSAVARPTPQAKPPAPDPALVRQRIARIQRQLAALGYSPGAADGVLGPKTRAAIRNFKVREGLRGKGTLFGSFEAALSSASGGADRVSPPASQPLKKVSTGSGFYAAAKATS
jgi:TPR repeat protein